jgi:hypothetical protein
MIGNVEIHAQSGSMLIIVVGVNFMSRKYLIVTTNVVMEPSNMECRVYPMSLEFRRQVQGIPGFVGVTLSHLVWANELWHQLMCSTFW